MGFLMKKAKAAGIEPTYIHSKSQLQPI